MAVLVVGVELEMERELGAVVDALSELEK